MHQVITSFIYNVNPHQSNAALSFPASEQEKRKKNTQHSVCSLSVCEVQYYTMK